MYFYISLIVVVLFIDLKYEIEPYLSLIKIKRELGCIILMIHCFPSVNRSSLRQACFLLWF